MLEWVNLKKSVIMQNGWAVSRLILDLLTTVSYEIYYIITNPFL